MAAQATPDGLVNDRWKNLLLCAALGAMIALLCAALGAMIALLITAVQLFGWPLGLN